jgi:hypothetical protein
MNFTKNNEIYSWVPLEVIKEIGGEWGWQNIDVYSFPQLWGSTTCGFGGVGGCAMTRAQTIVLISDCRSKVAVFIHGKLAYKINKPNKKFFQDLSQFELVGAYNFKKRPEVYTNVN